MNKECLSCNNIFPLTSEYFYSNGTYKGRTKFKPTCKKCEMADRSKKFYDTLSEVFGEIKCCVCGYDRCKQAIDCHHVDSSTKDYEIGDLRNSGIKSSTIRKELEKCVLLCAVCHREYHADFISIDFDKKTNGV